MTHRRRGPRRSSRATSCTSRPDKVHSLRPVSDHAPIHCFCFAVGVQGRGRRSTTPTTDGAVARVSSPGRLPDGGLDPLLDGRPRRESNAATTTPCTPRRARRAGRDGRRRGVPAHRPHRRRGARRRRRSAARGGQRRRRLRQHRRRRGAPRWAWRCATRRACSTRPRPTWRSCSSSPPPACASDAELDLRAGAWPGLGHQPVPRARRARRDARARRLRPHRPGGGPAGERLRHAACCTTPATDTGMPGYVGDLDELLAECDVVSPPRPADADTRHLIGARRAGPPASARRAGQHGARAGRRRGGPRRRAPRRRALRRRPRRLRARARRSTPACSPRPPHRAAAPHRRRPRRPGRRWPASPVRASWPCWRASAPATS